LAFGSAGFSAGAAAGAAGVAGAAGAGAAGAGAVAFGSGGTPEGLPSSCFEQAPAVSNAVSAKAAQSARGIGFVMERKLTHSGTLPCQWQPSSPRSALDR
jgi:hypothetical protein